MHTVRVSFCTRHQLTSTNTHRDQREVLHQRCPFGIRQLACTLVAHPAMDTTATTEDPQEVLEPEIL